METVEMHPRKGSDQGHTIERYRKKENRNKAQHTAGFKPMTSSVQGMPSVGEQKQLPSGFSHSSQFYPLMQ